ncbi:hypothetical protein CUBB_gp183 [Staphylococcus phage CUB-B]|nr:hypothetical protein CUBB_gp183 [Staphylococcus phage CUB-B]
MGYENETKNLIAKLSGVWVESEKKEILKELEEVYFKAEILNRIISIVKNGRSLGSDTDSEIILRAIEHELKYTEDE